MESTKRRALTRSAEYSVERQESRYALDAAISQLLQNYQEELNNTKNQLQCLIHFVRRAWSGDVQASIHVANIVGVAPPDLCLQSGTNKIVTTPKPAAINNWAILTHGLLKQEYLKSEKDQRTEQLEYLLERNEFLDKQLSRLGLQSNTRGGKDVLHFIDNKVHRDHKKEQHLKEASHTKKHRVSSIETYEANCWTGTPRDNFDAEKLKWFGLYIDASQPQLTQRKIATKVAWHGRATSARCKGSETASLKAPSSVPKTFPHERLSSESTVYLLLHTMIRS